MTETTHLRPCALDGCDGVVCARGQVPLACVNTAGRPLPKISDFSAEVAADTVNGVSMGRVEGVIGGVRYAVLVPPAMVGDRPAAEDQLRHTATLQRPRT